MQSLVNLTCIYFPWQLFQLFLEKPRLAMTIVAMCVFYAIALSGYYKAHNQMTNQLSQMQNELANVRKINAQILSGNYQVLSPTYPTRNTWPQMQIRAIQCNIPAPLLQNRG
jgi:hypothetical protein